MVSWTAVIRAGVLRERSWRACRPGRQGQGSGSFHHHFTRRPHQRLLAAIVDTAYPNGSRTESPLRRRYSEPLAAISAAPSSAETMCSTPRERSSGGFSRTPRYGPPGQAAWDVMRVRRTGERTDERASEHHLGVRKLKGFDSVRAGKAQRSFYSEHLIGA